MIFKFLMSKIMMVLSFIFYFDWKINILTIIIDLIIIVITTGFTYYFFSVLPKKKRKALLSNRLEEFRNELIMSILKGKENFKNSYNLETKRVTKNGEFIDLIRKVKINDWGEFISDFRMMTILDLRFRDYWQGNELIVLINNLLLDEEKYISLSTKITDLNHQINHTKVLLGKKADSIWAIRTKDDLISSDSDELVIHLALKSMEDVINISKDIVKIIDDILDIHE